MMIVLMISGCDPNIGAAKLAVIYCQSWNLKSKNQGICGQGSESLQKMKPRGGSIADMDGKSQKLIHMKNGDF